MKNVQEKIGYTFKNVNLLETALTHSSYANECKKENNERLEFLGDSVLSVIISDYIFRRLPKAGFQNIVQRLSANSRLTKYLRKFRLANLYCLVRVKK